MDTFTNPYVRKSIRDLINSRTIEIIIDVRVDEKIGGAEAKHSTKWVVGFLVTMVSTEIRCDVCSTPKRESEARR